MSTDRRTFLQLLSAGAFGAAFEGTIRKALAIPAHHRTGILLLVYYSNFFLIGICLYRIGTGQARPLTWAALVLSIAMSGLTSTAAIKSP